MSDELKIAVITSVCTIFGAGVASFGGCRLAIAVMRRDISWLRERVTELAGRLDDFETRLGTHGERLARVEASTQQPGPRRGS